MVHSVDLLQIHHHFTPPYPLFRYFRCFKVFEITMDRRSPPTRGTRVLMQVAQSSLIDLVYQLEFLVVQVGLVSSGRCYGVIYCDRWIRL